MAYKMTLTIIKF